MGGGWNCTFCTFLNEGAVRYRCAMCAQPRDVSLEQRTIVPIEARIRDRAARERREQQQRQEELAMIQKAIEDADRRAAPAVRRRVDPPKINPDEWGCGDGLAAEDIEMLFQALQGDER